MRNSFGLKKQELLGLILGIKMQPSSMPKQFRDWDETILPAFLIKMVLGNLLFMKFSPLLWIISMTSIRPVAHLICLASQKVYVQESQLTWMPILLRPVSLDEIRVATFTINPSKALGEDGFTGFFFQKFWHIVGEDVSEAVQHFFNIGELDPKS